jgi:metal-dependent amidase/aminoacylase/carboxypeptidase family protein
MHKASANAADPMLARLDGLLPDLETVYKDILAHPELSMLETRSAGSEEL